MWGVYDLNHVMSQNPKLTIPRISACDYIWTGGRGGVFKEVIKVK